MTAYETITVIIGLMSLLISFGKFIIALLSFDKREKKHKK